MKRKKAVAVCSVFFCCCVQAFAEAITLTLDPSLSGKAIDWESRESYPGAARDPAAGDTVVIPSGMTALLDASDSASWALVSSLCRVTPGDGSSFEVKVASGDAELGCAVSWYAQGTEISPSRGTLVKTGAGALILKRTSESLKVTEDGVTAYKDLLVNFDIREGAVKMPDDGPDNGTAYEAGRIDIAEGAYFFPANWSSGKADKDTRVHGITGRGTIKSENRNRIALSFFDTDDVADEFFGSFAGNIFCKFYDDFRYLGTSPDSTATSIRLYRGSTVTVSNMTLFGKSGNVGGTASTLRFAGADDFHFNVSMWLQDPFTIDSGTSSGFLYAGQILAGLNGKMHSLSLSGEESGNPAQFYGFFMRSTRPDTALYLSKRGPGTWRMRENEKNEFDGPIGVENGTLQFVSIAEQGEFSSLGYSTCLYSNVAPNATAGYVLADRYKVPWAFLLGGDGTEGMMEYVGTKNAECTTRPFAVASTGGVANSAASGIRLSLSGFSASGAGTKTLVLAGENAGQNTASDVTDAEYSNEFSGDAKAGVLGVEKRGGGTWRLSGEQTFSGPLSVKEGRLIVDNYQKGDKFRFFRFYFKENAFSACTNNTADGYYANIVKDDCIRWQNLENRTDFWGTNEFKGVMFSRMHFFDEKGTLAVSNCTVSARMSSKETSLEENSYTFTGENLPDFVPANGNQWPGNIFLPLDEPAGYRLNLRFSKWLKLDDPSSWGCMAIRIPDDAPEIRGYDLRIYRGAFTTPFAELTGRALVSWEVHGSADGISYEKLHVVDSFRFWGGPNGTDNLYWAYDQTNSVDFASSHADDKFYLFSHTRSTLDRTLPDPLQNVESISVSPGAVFEVRGSRLELDSLKIGAEGMGSLRNVKFAENGRIDLTGPADNGRLFPAGDIDAEARENLAGWAVTFNGTEDKTGKVVLTDDGLVYRRPPFVFLVR